MGFNCGIVGLPNVGKSTLFNALTQTAAAQAANFPFCTIEPNIGRVNVPDARLQSLANIAGSKEILPAQLEFVDIAGLVKGASKGEGLGNQFLANIRETDAIIHVLRCFEDGDIIHVDGSVDPIRDADTIETELMLSDLESLERQITSIARKVKSGDKDAKVQNEVMTNIKSLLDDGKPARTYVPANDDQVNALKHMSLLTSKPVLYVCNVNEDDVVDGNAYTQKVADMAAGQGAQYVIICASIEAEISQLETDEERNEFLGDLGLAEPGLSRIIGAGYTLLHLQTYFTCGPKETRAWTIPIGAKAPEAAGVIHTDFQRGFIRAEVIAYDDYISCKGEQGAKEQGKMRQEGKEYVVCNGDVILFRFNV